MKMNAELISETLAAKRRAASRGESGPPSVLLCTSLLALCLIVGAAELAAQRETRWSIAPTPETMIGGDFDDDAYMFESITSARLLPDGRIVVADNGARDIRIYSKDGKLQKRLGRSGYGPGEFQFIVSLWLTSQGTIAVWDGGTRRITILSSSGDLVRTQQVRGNPEGGNLEVFFGAFANDDIVLASLIGGPRSARATPDRWVLGRFSLNGAFAGPLGAVRGMWRVAGSPIPFTPFPAAVLYRDSLYVADGFESEISVRSPRGSLVRTIELPRAKQVSADAAFSRLEAEVRQRSTHSSSSVLRLLADRFEGNDVPHQDQFPQVGGLITDDRGYIWVKAYDPYMDSHYLRANAMVPAIGGEWWVVRPDGGLVTTVRMPETVRPLEIKGTRLLGVASDSLGVERIVVHAIRR